MQYSIKNLFGFKRLLVILGLTVFILTIVANKEVADAQTKSNYLIKVNRVYNTITIYEPDKDGKYTVPIKSMLCSVGRNGLTITGTFQTKAKYRWKLLMGDVWGQFSTRIVGGILFHSVYYYGKENPATLATKEFNKLGTSASHGCIRLAVKDAKWIYDNCSVGTTVVIYDDKKSPGPLGKPEAIKIAANVRWDPTDPDKKNPYFDGKPTISGVKNCKVKWSKKFNLLDGVKATSSSGVDITSKIKVKGKVDTAVPGKYKITYSVTDTLKKKVTKIITVTVLNNKIAPSFTGIENKVVNPEVTIDREYALTGVKAYVDKIFIDKKLINVSISKISDMEYEITYSASIGNGPETSLTSKIFMDQEAPVFSGIIDYTLEAGEIPSKEFVMSGVTVTDNYSPLEDIIVDVVITENEDGTYTITYKATDEAGNIAETQSKIDN